MARTTKHTSRKASKSTKTTGRASKKQLIKEYGPDTQGIELPEPTTKDPAKQKAKDAAYVARQQAKQYAGAPIPATRLFSRKMEEFKNCEAVVYMAINDRTGTVCYINSYNGSPRASFKPETYTYPLKEKVVAKKIDEMVELDVDQWPEFVTSAPAGAAKRSRKTATAK